MRIYTCTPVAFGGGEDFFCRDSGLLCRGLQRIGVTSRAVMPFPATGGDLPDLLRTEYANLESSAWWRQQALDGVILYSWGSPRYTKVAMAVHRAGLWLVLNQDSGGLASPLCGLGDWWREKLISSGFGRMPGAVRWLMLNAGKELTVGLCITDPRRARHLKQGDRIAAVSPRAAERYRKLCRIYGGENLAQRVTLVPHPVGMLFTYDGHPKNDRIVAVGRWADERQKRTSLLLRAIGSVLERDENVGVDLIGDPGDEMPAWHAGLPDGLRGRVVIHGRLKPAEIMGLMNRARVLYCPSAYESFHIAGAEALCCGCTVVASRLPSLPSFEWFTGDGDGALAAADDADGHADALCGELLAWRDGDRDPSAISHRWIARVHATCVAKSILKLLPAKE